MNISININKSIFNSAYYPYLKDYSNRFEVYYGGAGSGKSHFVTQKLLLKALASKRKVLVIRKVGATIKDSVFQLFLEILSQFKLTKYCYINLTNFTIKLPNGSVFLFKGLDDSEKIKSIVGITDIWIEEATEINQDDFAQLDLRLRAKVPNLQILLSFNPVSKANWVYKHFFEHKKNSILENTVIIKTTYKDNKFLPQSYIDSLQQLQDTNPAYYRIYVLGDFATLDKLVFPIIHKRVVNIDEIKNCPLWVGLDFGYVNDPSALTWGRLDQKNKRLYITGEYDKKGMDNDEIAKVIIDLGLSKEIIVADSAEQKSIEELRRLGIRRIRPAEKGPDSVVHGIDTLLSYQIIVDERCTKTIEEFENYTWLKDKKTGEYVNKPVDLFNHHIDSIRYGIQPLVKRTGTRIGGF